MLKKVAPKKVAPSKPAVKKASVKKIAPKKVKKVTDPRMLHLQAQQKELAVEEAKVKAQIKKEHQLIKTADAKCMSNAKNLFKHVMSIKAGIAEFSRALKGAGTSSVSVEAATEKLINKIQVSIDAVGVVRDLKFDVIKLIIGPDDSEDLDSDFDDL